MKNNSVSIEDVKKVDKLVKETLDTHEANRKHREPYSIDFEELNKHTNHIREISHRTNSDKSVKSIY